MNSQNKIIVLAVVGLVLGGVIGAVVNSEQVNVATLAAFGGIVGFLVGWVLKSRSDKSEE